LKAGTTWFSSAMVSGFLILKIKSIGSFAANAFYFTLL